MKRLLYLFVFILSAFLFLNNPSNISAEDPLTCYCFGTPDFITCQSGGGGSLCYDGGGVLYACCDYIGQCPDFPSTSCAAASPTSPPPGVCLYSIYPVTREINALAVNSFVTVSVSDSTCSWNASENEDWINIYEIEDVDDTTKNVKYSVLINNTPDDREGDITITTEGTSLVHTIKQATDTIPTTDDCPPDYTCTTATVGNCLLADGNFPRSCTLSGGGTGTCCEKPSTIPPPGSCTTPTGCFPCDWTSTGVCYYNPAASNTCALGYTPNEDLCAILSGTTDYICNATLFPCVELGAGIYGKCTINGCEYCIPDATNQDYCIAWASCITTCNNPDPTICDGTCRVGPGCVGDEIIQTGLNSACPLDYPVCCVAPNTVYSPPVFCDPESGSRTLDSDAGGIYTAIGCIPVASTQEFVKFLLGWAIGIAGGLAFILIIYGGFLVITSVGNPQKVQAGKELITAAAGGLLLLIFGAFVLEFIGVDILNIPGFGR